MGTLNRKLYKKRRLNDRTIILIDVGVSAVLK